MVGKIRAAADARAEQDIVLITRTDARAVTGFDDALERCLAYEEAGADVVFFEAPESVEEMEQVARAISVPKLINIVEDGKTPCLPADELEPLGYKIAIYPAMLFTTAAWAMQKELARFKNERVVSTPEYRVRFSEMQEIVGFPWYYGLEEKYGR